MAGAEQVGAGAVVYLGYVVLFVVAALGGYWWACTRVPPVSLQEGAGWLKLSRALLCSDPDCRALFHPPRSACPACAESEYWPVESFLERVPASVWVKLEDWNWKEGECVLIGHAELGHVGEAKCVTLGGEKMFGAVDGDPRQGVGGFALPKPTHVARLPLPPAKVDKEGA